MQHHASSFYSKSLDHVTQTSKTHKRIVLEHVPAPISLKLGALAKARDFLAQATSSRLGETANKEHWKALRVLAWTAPSRLSEIPHRSKMRSPA